MTHFSIPPTGGGDLKKLTKDYFFLFDFKNKHMKLRRFLIPLVVISTASICIRRVHADDHTKLLRSTSRRLKCDGKAEPYYASCRHYKYPQELNVESPALFTGTSDNDVDAGIDDFCVPKDQNGFYGITSTTRTPIEFLYEVTYDDSPQKRTNTTLLDTKTVFLIEQAISNGIMPTLLSSCDNNNFLITKPFNMVGLSTWPADVVLEGDKCTSSGIWSNLHSCNVVKGQMHIYIKDGLDGTQDGIAALASIQLMMDAGKFDNLNDKIFRVNYINGTVMDTVLMDGLPEGSPTSKDENGGGGGGLASGDFPLYGFILIALVPLILMATLILKHQRSEALRSLTEEEARSWLMPLD